MAAADEREIEVRTLTGESTKIVLSVNATVDDLKKLISGLGFPSSPNFHLFFKGVKLNVQSHVRTLDVGKGEFLVLIPFVKKQKVQTLEPDFSLRVAKQSPISKFADLAYVDMMQELSSLRNDESGDASASGVPGQLDASRGKRGSDCFDDSNEVEDGPYSFLWSAMQSSSKSITEGQNGEKFVEILEGMGCLRNPHSRRCVLLAGWASGDAGVYRDNGVPCLCPAWLKQISQVFTFLNIFSAFIQMQRKHVTSVKLKDAINQLGKHGFKAGFEDIEHLSILCPKVVRFSDNCAALPSSADSLLIFNSEREEKDETANNFRSGQKAIRFLSKIFNSMKKWESHFKTNLWNTVKLLMQKKGNVVITDFSLEDLLNFVKQNGASISGKGTKREQSNRVAAPCSFSFRTCCRETTQLLPVEMVEHLRKGIGSKGQIVHVEDIDARMANFVDLPNNLSTNTKNALKRLGISKFYSHQAESILASLAGKNVVVATMTSSGKSLCYNVPVLEVLSQNLSSCALYLFPTKALAQDQLRALLALTKGLGTNIHMGIYDGDTSKKDRSWLRTNARLLITNPDMLHVSILPHHREFSRILSNLRFVVVDEAHTYKGAFGCHTALILRRLQRLSSHVYGSDPSFIFSTATSANPREHCMELANLSTLELIKNDGSPSSRKLFVLWNPSICRNAVSNESDIDMHASASVDRSMSPISEVSYLFAEMVQHGLRCIAFCRSRKLTEIVLSYTSDH